jgi:hypothetical protein
LDAEPDEPHFHHVQDRYGGDCSRAGISWISATARSSIF